MDGYGLRLPLPLPAVFWVYACEQNLDFSMMNSPQQATSRISRRLTYITLLLPLFAAAIGNDQTSPTLSNLSALAEPRNACAPVGSPCVEVNPAAD